MPDSAHKQSGRSANNFNPLPTGGQQSGASGEAHFKGVLLIQQQDTSEQGRESHAAKHDGQEGEGVVLWL